MRRRLLALISACAVLSAYFVPGTLSAPLRPDSNELLIQSAGHIGGSVTGIVARGDLIFLSVGTRLEVRDVSNPSTPVRLGRSDELPPGSVIEAVDDRAAYLVQRVHSPDSPKNDILQVVDITNIASPHRAASLVLDSEDARSLAVSGTILFAADERGVSKIDVSDLTRPRVIDRIALGAVNALAVADGLLVAGSDDSIWTLDIADPAAPRVVGRIDEVGADVVTVSGDRIYASAGDLSVIDIREPTSPHLVERSTHFSRGSVSLLVSEGTAWVSARPCCVRDSFHVYGIDVSTSPMRYIVNEHAYVSGLAQAGGRIWATAGAGGIARLEVSGDEVTFIAEERTLGEPAGITESGGHLILTDSDFEVWTIGNAASGTPASAVLPLHDGPWHGISSPGPVAVAGRFAFLDETALGPFWGRSLSVVDVENPSAPSLISTSDLRYDDLDGSTCQWGADPPVIVSDQLYLSGGPNLLDVDLLQEPPALARSYESIEAHCGAGGPAIIGDTAWLATGEPWLEGIALDDPSGSLELRSMILTDRPTYGIAAAGGFLLVGTGTGLLVVDPEAGRVVTAADHIRAGWSISVVEDRALVFENAIGTDYFTILDVEDPTKPQVIGRHPIEKLEYPPPRYATLMDGYAFFTDGDSGVQVLLVTEADEFIPEPTVGPTVTQVAPTHTPDGPGDTPTPSVTPAQSEASWSAFLPLVSTERR